MSKSVRAVVVTYQIPIWIKADGASAVPYSGMVMLLPCAYDQPEIDSDIDLTTARAFQYALACVSPEDVQVVFDRLRQEGGVFAGELNFEFYRHKTAMLEYSLSDYDQKGYLMVRATRNATHWLKNGLPLLPYWFLVQLLLTQLTPEQETATRLVLENFQENESRESPTRLKAACEHMAEHLVLRHLESAADSMSVAW